jgi:hypothetical protein
LSRECEECHFHINWVELGHFAMDIHEFYVFASQLGGNLMQDAVIPAVFFVVTWQIKKIIVFRSQTEIRETPLIAETRYKPVDYAESVINGIEKAQECRGNGDGDARHFQNA